MIVDADTLGRMAIRLGRAYGQAWAKDVAKSVPWNWDMAKYYVDICKSSRLPVLDEERVTITYDDSSTHWTLSQEKVSIDFYDRKRAAYIGYVRCDVDALGAPVISVRIDHPKSMVKSSLWRVDKAITSLSTSRWQPLYSLPPVQVMFQLLGAAVVPECPVTLFYRVGSDGPTIDVAGIAVGQSERESFAVFDDAFKRLKDRGVMAKWERAYTAQVGA
jgi:hypothetical protein